MKNIEITPPDNTFDETLFWLKLHRCPGVGYQAWREIYSIYHHHSHHEGLTQFLETRHAEVGISSNSWSHFQSEKLHQDCLDELDQVKQSGSLLLHAYHPAYPDSLKQSIWRVPTLSFYQAATHSPDELMRLLLAENLKLKLGMVGSRNTSHNATDKIKDLCSHLQGQEIQILSGNAQGIDRMAHLEAMNCGLSTLAILGTGIQLGINKLRSRDHQLILASQFPPKYPASKRTFPIRNQIIAGMCHSLMVVECRVRSGSLITYQQAFEDGKTIWAHSGSWKEPQSSGPISIINQGAIAIRNGEQLLQELPLHHPGFRLNLSTPQQGPAAQIEDPQQAQILELLERGGMSVFDITNALDLEHTEILHSLHRLELFKLISFKISGKWEKT